MLNLTQLVGFGAGGGGVKDFTLTFVDSATSGGASIKIPATAQEGDICILVDSAYRSLSGSSPTGVTTVVPSGFTTIANTTNRYNTGGSFPVDYARRSIVSRKILTSGDAGTSITGMNEASESKVIVVFRPATIPTTVTIFDNNGTTAISGSNPSPYTIEATATPNLVIAWSANSNLTSTPTPTGEIESGNDVDYFIFNAGVASDVTADIGTAPITLASVGAFGLRLS
jgi:hypothetical protein